MARPALFASTLLLLAASCGDDTQDDGPDPTGTWFACSADDCSALAGDGFELTADGSLQARYYTWIYPPSTDNPDPW